VSHYIVWELRVPGVWTLSTPTRAKNILVGSSSISTRVWIAFLSRVSSAHSSRCAACSWAVTACPNDKLVSLLPSCTFFFCRWTRALSYLVVNSSTFSCSSAVSEKYRVVHGQLRQIQTSRRSGNRNRHDESLERNDIRVCPFHSIFLGSAFDNENPLMDSFFILKGCPRSINIGFAMSVHLLLKIVPESKIVPDLCTAFTALNRAP
jgi:hypothetical protein